MNLIAKDHAAGQLLVELAGGKVTDMYGSPLDFGKGRALQSKGVIASEKHAHGRVIEAAKKVIQAG
jgi:3'(2'), 5'-bisphosphate nucleotidase